MQVVPYDVASDEIPDVMKENTLVVPDGLRVAWGAFNSGSEVILVTLQQPVEADVQKDDWDFATATTVVLLKESATYRTWRNDQFVEGELRDPVDDEDARIALQMSPL